MPTLTTYHVTPPPSGTTLTIHFGRQGIGYEEAAESWSSDSLFSALVTQAAFAEGFVAQTQEAPVFAQAFTGASPPLLLSSLFPRIASLVLLPRPALKLPDFDAALRQKIGKGFKKLRYLSPALFQAVCQGDSLSDEPIIMQQGQVWITPQEAKGLPAPWNQRPQETDVSWRSRLASEAIWRIEQVPRVTVDRVHNASAFYEVGRVVYAEQCGLGLFVQYHEPTWQPRLELLLNLLGESGLGGRRNSGYGACTFIRAAPTHFPDSSAAQRVVLLSRYLPRRDELTALQAPGASYNLVDVGGWLYSPGVAGQLRQQITMVAEGSVLSSAATQPVVGRIADVRPDYASGAIPHPVYGRGTGTSHPVYRSGLALGVPVTAKE